jgi:16S rRNA (guanine527-N7)-methyltransferase
VTPEAIASLLQPYLPGETLSEQKWPHVCGQLSTYLDLLTKWNARTNLTAIRDPEEIVRRHFGESLFAATHLGECATLLDFGSGAGFPGVPIQLLRPDLQVTLAESQGKKAAFLREVCRHLALPTEIFAARVETMPPDRQFDVVILRAVDKMESAMTEATRRSRQQIMTLTTELSSAKAALDGFTLVQQIAVPQTDGGALNIYAKR